MTHTFLLIVTFLATSGGSIGISLWYHWRLSRHNKEWNNKVLELEARIGENTRNLDNFAMLLKMIFPR